MKRFKKNSLIFLALIFIVTMSLMACGQPSENDGQADKNNKKDTIVFADAGWDSIRFHNSVAGIIVKEGLGYDTDVIPGTTAATFLGFRQGQIDVYMEAWQDNIIEQYTEAIEKEEIVPVTTNFDDNSQGLYVPTYVIKGDEERGIEPMAPELKTVKDLAKYPEIFTDPEDNKKGRIYGAPSSWSVSEIVKTKVQNYGLSEKYNVFDPGSDTSLATSLASAIDKGEPWVGYYWDPTWVTGKYDLTLLEDEPFDEEKWEDGYRCEFKPVDVTVCVTSDLENTAPDVVEFLKNYTTSSALTAEALAYIQENNATADDAAEWFLKEHEEVWTKWVSEEVVQKVKEAIK
ncbi:ABC transporter substrate-binding protein [Maledivibacter halophilus]|uniref:Glycine betaine/proline transport system substrate-binding protein n=1 Tax=Maledivibacter halophilus TaxID=36842 RepID=A0A1T5J680_9FIRM|nr:ABC transporter substrate-binding protein [Maledivibacter halophilus]SKC46920.1 glycine betaine/proline transport system substrate-binding protein [Maledivibacter halophilus]